MPYAPKRPCTTQGCGAFQEPGSRKCVTHKRQEQQGIDRARGSAASRGYDARWQRARDHFLIEHPFCIECERRGVTGLATVVDHKVPHKGDQVKFWDISNWQPLCKPHHDLKTALEDGRWG